MTPDPGATDVDRDAEGIVGASVPVGDGANVVADVYGDDDGALGVASVSDGVGEVREGDGDGVGIEGGTRGSLGISSEGGVYGSGLPVKVIPRWLR